MYILYILHYNSKVNDDMLLFRNLGLMIINILIRDFFIWSILLWNVF